MPNTVYFPLRSAALLSTFFHSFLSQHCLFSSLFRCATLNFPSFIHSHPNTVYFPLRSAALHSTFLLSFILIPTLFIFLFVLLRYTQLSFFHSFSSQHSLFSSLFRCATLNFPSFIHSHPNTVYFSLPSAALLSTFILSFIFIQFVFGSKRLKTFFVVSLGQPRPTWNLNLDLISNSELDLSVGDAFHFFTFLIDFADNFQR